MVQSVICRPVRGRAGAIEDGPEDEEVLDDLIKLQRAVS
jgi:hypothetical protein